MLPLNNVAKPFLGVPKTTHSCLHTHVHTYHGVAPALSSKLKVDCVEVYYVEVNFVRSDVGSVEVETNVGSVEVETVGADLVEADSVVEKSFV